MFCGSGACTLGIWSGVCIVGGVIAAAAIGLLGFFLYRRNKKTDKISTSQ